MLRVGGGRCDWADVAVAEWKKRLVRGLKVEEVDVAPEPYRGDVERVRTVESERIARQLKPRDRLVVFDERGEALTTEGFRNLVSVGRADGDLVLALGGGWGHSEALRARAWRVVRLSDLVLAHDVARVVLWEQLYRTWTMEQGGPYHHEG